MFKRMHRRIEGQVTAEAGGANCFNRFALQRTVVPDIAPGEFGKQEAAFIVPDQFRGKSAEIVKG